MEITSETQKDIDLLLMLFPLAKSTQKNITETEKRAFVDFSRKGGRMILMVNEEEYRVRLKEYGANNIAKPFGIELGDDIRGLAGNCGAVSFENEFSEAGARFPTAIPVSSEEASPPAYAWNRVLACVVCAIIPGGGRKLYVVAETMVGLLMGYPDGERNFHKMMQTR